MVNAQEEMAKLEEELKYTRGFLNSVQKKMSNERFVQNAPAAVVEKEKQKMADAHGKIAVLEAQIQKLKAQA
jgi:valyl-tRNA synthetase